MESPKIETYQISPEETPQPNEETNINIPDDTCIEVENVVQSSSSNVNTRQNSQEEATTEQQIPPNEFYNAQVAVCGFSPIPLDSSIDDIPPPKPDFYAPPPYEVATEVTKLPTYEEVQREKHLEGQAIPITTATRPSQYRVNVQRILSENAVNETVDTSLLGTDFMFYIAFFVAFIFNWIGFLLLMCFCHTIASRYGALSGFGLSLAKWTFIVQHSTDLASKDNSWLWWLIMTFGLIICIRAILQYLSIKRGWHMLSASHQERLLFFY